MPTLHELSLRHPDGVTEILAGEGALAAVEDRLAPWLDGRAAFVVSTPRVLALQGDRLSWIDGRAARRVTLEVPEGEAAKTVAEAARLWERMLAAGGKRDSRVVAFGGGSVGDLAGFVAGCFLRGVEFVQAPTTLLAQVDAAIGGKTGVDLPGGKNTVGLFHHPAAVVADAAVLATLPRDELRSGLVEVIKMAALFDPALLARVEEGLDGLLGGDPAALAPVVAAAAAAKIGVVERDPDERGDRRLLNFGHTLGHALESALGYRGLRHGEAVAYGMLFALRLAARRGLDETSVERLRRPLARLALPPLPDAGGGGRLDVEALLALIGRDKKARESGIVWVLPDTLGRGRLVTDVQPAEVRSELAGFLRDPWHSAL
jgi:3-dehydroquinate synthase